jgi:hypothetical protein
MSLTVLFFLHSRPLDSGAVGCEKRRQLASAIIDEFCACVIPLEQQLERGIIHGDFNEQVVINRWKNLFVGPEPTVHPPHPLKLRKLHFPFPCIMPVFILRFFYL